MRPFLLFLAVSSSVASTASDSLSVSVHAGGGLGLAGRSTIPARTSIHSGASVHWFSAARWQAGISAAYDHLNPDAEIQKGIAIISLSALGGFRFPQHSQRWVLEAGPQYGHFYLYLHERRLPVEWTEPPASRWYQWGAACRISRFGWRGMGFYAACSAWLPRSYDPRNRQVILQFGIHIPVTGKGRGV